MNSRSAVTSVCRACGQRSITSRSNAPRPKLAIPATARSISTPRQTLRPLSTTSQPQVQPVDDVSLSSTAPPSDPIPTSVPPSATTSTTTEPSPPPQRGHQDQKQKSFTATITSIHNLTAHATYTKQYWDPKFRRYYTKQEHTLVHDPFSANLESITSTPRYQELISSQSESAPQTPSPSQPNTSTHQPHAHAPRPSLLRIHDVVSITPLSPSELLLRSQRSSFFSTLELTRKLKSAGKHRQQIINEHTRSLQKRTRTNRGVRFVVREVLTPFGESLEERVRKLQQAGGKGIGGVDETTIVGGERLAWWKRREQRGALKK